MTRIIWKLVAYGFLTLGVGIASYIEIRGLFHRIKYNRAKKTTILTELLFTLSVIFLSVSTIIFIALDSLFGF